MRWLFAFVLLAISASADAAYWQGQTYAGPPQITCNLVTGVASVGGPCTATTLCNGSADDAPAFKAFNTWAVANQGSSNQVVLTIPTGATCFFNSNQTYPASTTGQANIFTIGINNLIVDGGSGATLTSVGGTGFVLGVEGVCQQGIASGSGCSARIQTVSAGATQVTLTAASFAAGYISRFSVGKWIMIGGLDVQGLFQAPFGFPPNQTYFEWRQITAICNNTVGCVGSAVITLSSQLNNTYLSTWPNYNSGSAFEADAGGAATIWLMGDYWNSQKEFRNLTLSQNGQIGLGGRYQTLRGVTVTNTGGNCGPLPTQNEYWSMYNSTYSCNVEVDKLVGNILMDTSTFNSIEYQSNSIANLTMRNSTAAFMYGSARNSQIIDTTLNFWRPGTHYGAAESVVCIRCAVTTYDPPPQGTFGSNLTPPAFTMASGVISWPVDLTGHEAQTWASPTNVPVFFGTSAAYNSIGVFRATGISGGTWPAGDNQTANPTVTIGLGSKNLNVSTNLFASGDVGKVIAVGGAGGGGGAFTLYTHIVTFTDAQNVVLYDAAASAVAGVVKTVQWGTAPVNVQTNQAGGFPSLASLGGNIIFRVSQAYQFTCDACTGDAVLTAMNIQNGATPLSPIGSFSKRTYTAQAAGGSIGAMTGQGKLVSLTIDVTQAYTGSGAGILNPTGQFHNYTIKQSDWTEYDWVPVINVKQSGTRVITPSGVTCNGSPGGCSGDTNMTVPEAVWVQSGVAPSLSLAGSGGVNPTFSITLQTDQTP